MIREIVNIDEELCDGCGLCIPNCHEGALQIIDNKAVLVSDLMCDGLGACLGHCPLGAITIEKREAEDYDEVKVMAEMVKKGKNTVLAHLRHLKDHDEKVFVQQGVRYLMENQDKIDFEVKNIIQEIHQQDVAHQPKISPQLTVAPQVEEQGGCSTGGCPGSAEKSFVKLDESANNVNTNVQSELTHWPVQLHLINPHAAFFQNSDLLIAADCTAFSYGNFHNDFVKGKSMIIACPKLDEGLDVYTDKIQKLIDNANVNTITAVIMEVPCCGGLVQIVQSAAEKATRKVPIKLVVIGVQGDIVMDKWI